MTNKSAVPEADPAQAVSPRGPKNAIYRPPCTNYKSNREMKRLKQGETVPSLARQPSKTAWTMLHRLRRAMARPGRDLLTGRVEVDECYLGGPMT